MARAFATFSFTSLLASEEGSAAFSAGVPAASGFSIQPFGLLSTISGEVVFSLVFQVSYSGAAFTIQVKVDGALAYEAIVSDDHGYYVSSQQHNAIFSVTSGQVITLHITPDSASFSGATGSLAIISGASLAIASGGGSGIANGSGLAGRMQALAAKLIDKHGAAVVITMRSPTPLRDNAKPWRGSTGSATVSVKAVQYPYTEEEATDVNFRRGNSRFLIAENDLQGDSQFATVDLTQATSIDDNAGHVWSIDDVEIIQPGATRVLYQVLVRR